MSAAATRAHWVSEGYISAVMAASEGCCHGLETSCSSHHMNCLAPIDKLTGRIVVGTAHKWRFCHLNQPLLVDATISFSRFSHSFSTLPPGEQTLSFQEPQLPVGATASANTWQSCCSWFERKLFSFHIGTGHLRFMSRVLNTLSPLLPFWPRDASIRIESKLNLIDFPQYHFFFARPPIISPLFQSSSIPSCPWQLLYPLPFSSFSTLFNHPARVSR